MVNDFEVAAGSIVGTDHLGDVQILLGKNNQDAYVVRNSPSAIVAIICDGCGSGKHSELGAQLGAASLAHHLSNFSDDLLEDYLRTIVVHGTLNAARKDVLSELRVLAKSIGNSLSETVNEYLLFTVIGVMITKNWTAIFSCGDGIFHLNGETVELQPEAGNQPAYLGYNLTGSSLTDSNPSLLNFQVQRLLETKDVESIIIASDGAGMFPKIKDRNVPGKQESAGDLDQFFADKYFANPDAIRRRLALLNTRRIRMNPEGDGIAVEHGLLKDDTTIVSIRRKQPAGDN